MPETNAKAELEEYIENEIPWEKLSQRYSYEEIAAYERGARAGWNACRAKWIAACENIVK